MADPHEVDRFAAQRKALSTMLARFTADRDSLITAIQACQEQLASIASRIDTGGDTTDQLGEVRHLVERMRQDQDQIETARERFAEVGTMLAHLEGDRDAHATKLRAYETQLAELSQRVGELQNSSAQLARLRDSVEEIRGERGQLEESWRTALHQVTEPLANDVETLQKALAEIPAAPAADVVEAALEQQGLVERLASEQQAVTSTLDVTQQQLNELAQHVRELLVAAQQPDHTLQRQVEELQEEQRQIQGELRASLTQASVGLSDALGRLQYLESEYYGLNESNQATTARIAAVQDSFAAALVACQEHLAALRGRFDATLAGEVGSLAELSARLDVLQDEQRRQIAAQQLEQRKITDELQATLTHASETAEHLQVASLDLGQRLSGLETAVEQRLSPQQQGLSQAVTECRVQLDELGTRIEAGQDATQPQLAVLQERVEQLCVLRGEIESIAQGAVEAAVQHTDQALGQLRGLLDEQAERLVQSTESRLDLERRQHHLDQVLQAAQEQVGAFAAQLDGLRSTHIPEIEDLRGRISAVLDEQRSLTARIDQALAAAIASAQGAVQQVETLAAAQRSSSSEVAAAFADAASDRQQLQAINQDLQRHLHELSASLETESAASRAAVVELQSTLENVRRAQQESEIQSRALIERASEQSASALQQAEAAAQARRQSQEDVDALAALLNENESGFTTALKECRERIMALESSTRSVDDIGPGAAALTGEIVQLHERFEAQQNEARSELGRVAGQAESILGRLATLEHGLATHQSASEAREHFETQIGDALQECRQQLSALGTQLNAQLSGGRALAGEIQQLVEAGQNEVRQHLDTIRTTAEDANQRSNRLGEAVELLRRDVEAARGKADGVESAQRNLEGQGASALERLGREGAALRTMLEEVQQHFRAARQEDATVRQSLEANVRTLATQLSSTTTRFDDLQAGQESIAQRTNQIAEQLVAEQQSRGAAVRQLENQIHELGLRLEQGGNTDAPQVAEWRADLEQLRQQLAAGQSQAGGLLEEAQARFISLAQRVHDATTAQSETLLALHEQLEVVRNDQGALRQSFADTLGQADPGAVQHAVEQANAGLAELRHAIEALRSDQSHSEHELRSSTEAARLRADTRFQALEELRPITDALHARVEQHDEKLRGLEDLAVHVHGNKRDLDALRTQQQLSVEHTLEIDQRLAEEARQRAAAIAACMVQLAELAQRLEANQERIGPQGSELAEQVQQLQQQFGEFQKHAGGALDKAQARLIALAERVQDATTAQSETLLALSDQVEAVRDDQGPLRETVAQARAQVEEVSAEMNRLALHADSEHSALRVGLQDLRHQMGEKVQEIERASGSTRRSIEQLRQVVDQVQSERLQVEQELRTTTEAARSQADTAQVRAAQAHDVANALSPLTNRLEEELERVRGVAVSARSRADNAVQAVEEIRTAADDLRQHADDLSVVQSQADHLAAALSRLEARVLPTRGVARSHEKPVADLSSRRRRSRRVALRALGPALAASLTIVATLGTALIVVPSNSRLGRRLDEWFGRTVEPVSVAGLTDPQDIAAFDTAIDSLHRRDFIDAEAGFREVLRHDPGCVEARNNLAATLVEEHRLEAAAEQLREALATRPDYSRARANLEHVEALLAAAGTSSPAASQRNPASKSDEASPPTVAGDAPPAGSMAPPVRAAPKREDPAIADTGRTNKPANVAKRHHRAEPPRRQFDFDDDFDSFDLD